MEHFVITKTMAKVMWAALYFEAAFLVIITGYILGRLFGEWKRQRKMKEDVDFWD